MERYEKIELEVIRFDAEDVISTSGVKGSFDTPQMPVGG